MSMKPITIAQEVLGRYVPPTNEELILTVGDAQKVVAEALRMGDIRASRWLVKTLYNCRQMPGISDQLSPLLQDLDLETVERDPELAVHALFLARELSLIDLAVAAGRGCRKGMASAAARTNPFPDTSADELGHHDCGEFALRS